MTRATQPRSDRRVNAIIAMALAAGTFVLLLPFLDASMTSIRGSVLHMVDEGTILSNADRVSRGDALYREVFDFKGPTSYLPYVVAYKFAPPTARTGRLVMFAIVAFWAAVMFETTRRITGRRSLGIVVALLVPLQIWQAWTYAYQDFTAQLFLALAVLAALTSLQTVRARGSTARRPEIGVVAAGFFAALALWASLAQGLTGLVSLGLSATLVAWIMGGNREAVRTVAGLGLGVVSATAAVFIWLGSMGAVRSGIEAMLVFPFKHYAGGANATPYAYDAAIYPERWPSPPWVHLAAQTMMQTTRLLPLVALAMAAPVATWLVVRALRPAALLRPELGPRLARVALPASLAATAVPLVLGKTRSDICHLGFIEGGCLLALVAVFAVRPRGFFAGSASALLRGITALALIAVLTTSGAFYVHTLRVKPAGFVDIDVVGRADYSADYLAARTRPTDRIFVTSYGGWYYLYSRRDNATSFAFLMDDPYSAEQWPVAARQIVERRPLLLLIPGSHFGKLQSYQPRIASMYFGASGNYMLDERGAGPVFPLPGKWELAALGSDGRKQETFEVSLREDGGHAKLIAAITGRPGTLMAAIHRDVVSVFDGARSYVGQISSDGSQIAGTAFGPGTEQQRLVGRRLSE